MKHSALLLFFVLLLSLHCFTVYCVDETSPDGSATITSLNTSQDQNDVLLVVPKLKVDTINLTISSLEANVNLNAKVANILNIQAGVDVKLGQTNLVIQGVSASLLLKINLTNVARVIDRVLTTIDRNPQIVSNLVTGLSNLLSSTINQAGQTVQRFVDTLGNIFEKVLDNAGNILDQTLVGSVSSLQVISSIVDSATGNIITRVRDVSGAIIEVVYNSAQTKILSAKVV